MTKARSNATAPAAKGEIVVGTGTDASGILSVGSANQVLTVDLSTATGLKWATPASGALTWTMRQMGSNGGLRQINTIAYNGSNLYVVAGNNGYLATSPDAITWTERTSGFGSNNINKVIYANSIWVAVGHNGTITTSTDGTTWTARTSNFSTNIFYDITYAASNFVAVGTNGGTVNTGGLVYSTDGITWTRKSQSLTVGATYYCIVHNGTNFVIGTNVSTNNFLYASSPSGTWTVGLFGASQALNALWSDGTRTYAAVGNDIYGTTSATMATGDLWYYTSAMIGASPNENRLGYYYNGRIYQANYGFYYNWSTTPSSVFPYIPSNATPVTVNPVGFPDVTGQRSFYVNAIWAGAAGVILAGAQGQIFTSF